MTKICTKCKKEYPIEQFNKRSSVKSGRTSQCKSCISIYDISKRENRKLYSRLYYKNNSQLCSIRSGDWAKKNRTQVNKNRRVWENNKKITDIQFKLTKLLRNRIASIINKNYRSGSAIEDLGCSASQLKLYLESQFQSGMTWDNHGDWHVDHIIPLSSFDLSIRYEFLEACNYLNLQPLWAIDNLKKSNKIV